MNNALKNTFRLLFVFTASIYLGNSCKKIDTSLAVLNEENLIKSFFKTKEKPNAQVSFAIEALKKENEKSGFLGKLPANCGLPIWEKIVLVKQAINNNSNTYKNGNTNSAFQSEGDSNTVIIIPLTQNNKELSSIIIAEENAQNGFYINFCSQDYLNVFVHDSTVTTKDAEKALKLFFYMENNVFNTTAFYHIPSKFFPKITTLDNDNNKTLIIKSISPPILNLAITVCFTVCCSVCNGNDPNCPLGGCWQECITYTGGDGGGVGCPWCPPPPSPGGGGGGGGGGGTTCNAPFYLANPNPCNPPPPPPQNPCDSVIGSLEYDSTFKVAFNYLNQYSVTHQNYESGYMVSNRAQNSYIAKSGNVNDPVIDWADALQPNTLVNGCLHSHYCYSTNQCLSPMFSARDVVLMAQIYLTGHARDTNNLFMGVTSAGPNPYLIKVNNTTAFRAFAQKIAGANGQDDKKIAKFLDTYANKFNSPDVGITELEFLEMLQSEGGLNAVGVYRSQSNCHNWQKLGLNSVGGVSVLNCY